MGIVLEEVEKFNLNGKEYVVELNEEDVIHLHADNFRIEYSLDEFKEFVRCIRTGEKRLKQMKQL